MGRIITIVSVFVIAVVFRRDAAPLGHGFSVARLGQRALRAHGTVAVDAPLAFL